jgi:hypothetical protein
MGVPFEKNHRDPVTAGAPLNLSCMFWVWNAGYKFLRFDYTSTGQPRGAFLHLGSTNCSPPAVPDLPVVPTGNVVTVDLPLRRRATWLNSTSSPLRRQQRGHQHRQDRPRLHVGWQ